ncbi:S41 family peptidase [Roseibacterium beibuensis]|uniref:S41 family peptidase n=1 Tax=[Roseibacterium] beibuensis TaxID=1193142 RepID=UPI00217ECE3B|nr:S41 family peptidase [Roseibacterium beibuensis]MCS6625505.1 S41 family peptidase [Roseibacterium beibuensis]
MFAAVAIAAALQQSPASEPFDAAARIAEAIAVVRPVAYRSAEVDWTAIEADMRARSVGARDTVDMLPAYAALMHGLGDGHSFIQPTEEAGEGWRERHGDRRMLPDIPPRPRPTSTFMGRRGVTQRSVPVNAVRTVEAVVTPAVMGAGEKARTYASDLFRALADAGPTTCGYILDLRGNTGGNVWPMLTGLSPLLGDGPAGRSADATGAVETYAELREGSAVILAEEGRGQVLMSAAGWRPVPRLAEVPVALLIDDGVFSSGEGVAVAFKGRPLTRFFGQRSGGLASANNGFPLSDGTNLVVTVAMMLDRNDVAYPHGVDPDVAVGAGEGDPSDPEDAVVEAARDWLAQQTACAI